MHITSFLETNAQRIAIYLFIANKEAKIVNPFKVEKQITISIQVASNHTIRVVSSSSINEPSFFLEQLCIILLVHHLFH